MTRLLVFAALLSACNSGTPTIISSTTPDAAVVPDMTPAPDMTPVGDLPPDDPTLGALMPQAVRVNNNVIKNPRVVAITFDNDVNRADFDKFFVQLRKSDYWAQTTAEYGIGPIAGVATRHLSDVLPATVTNADVQAILVAHLGGAQPDWGVPKADTVYMVFLPATTVLDDPFSGTGCVEFDGYHTNVFINNVLYSYAIIQACPDPMDPTGSTLDDETITASHELIEASTDPYFDVPAWAVTDDAHAVWTYVDDGELADHCEFADTAAYQPPDMTYTVQRIWSNAEAARGHDPCVPAGTYPYYQTIPEDADDATITLQGRQPWSTQGVQIAVGATRNVNMTVYANGAAGPFTIAVYDYSEMFLGGDALLAITSASTPMMVMPGDTFSVPITVNATDPNMDGGEALVIVTTPVGDGPSTIYFALVTQ